MDYLYSQLNKQVETATYQGRSTGTIEVIVDNVNYTISGNVLDIPQYYINLITSIKDNLDLEIERAVASEQSISRNLNSEINRAINAESQLQTAIENEKDRAELAESVLRIDLASEVSRATQSEQGIQDNVTAVATDLAVERTRATNAENAIATNLSLETQRAKAREDSIETSLLEAIAEEAETREDDDEVLQANIEAEATRATTAEQALQDELDAEEATRAQNDTTLQTNISTETARAELAEQNLRTALESETSTRLANDTTLQTNITAEYTRATTKEAEIDAVIEEHLEDIDNPHQVTKTQIGLSEVDNTSDANKPISTAAQTALDLKLDKSNANQNVTNGVSVAVEEDNVYVDVTAVNLTTGSTSGPVRNQVPLADTDNAGLMSTADYSTLYDLKDRVENLEGKTTRLLYTASTTPTAAQINAFVIAEGYTEPFEGIAVVIDETYHIWHYYENDNIGWRDDGVDTTSTFTNDNAGIIQGSVQDGKVFAETDGTGSVNGWGDLKARVTTNEGSISTINTTLQSTNADLNQTMLDLADLEDRVYDATYDATASATTLEPTQPATATATVTYDETTNKYTYDFDFAIPKGEVGEADCSEDASTGVINYTLEHETDRTYTSDAITAFNITIPSQMFHGFYAGVNFRTGTTPPTISVTGASGLAFPIKLLQRSGIQVQSYTLDANSNVLIVVMCDGVNVYCNLMEVN